MKYNGNRAGVARSHRRLFGGAFLRAGRAVSLLQDGCGMAVVRGLSSSWAAPLNSLTLPRAQILILNQILNQILIRSENLNLILILSVGVSHHW